jgi:hypothetical protein
MAQPMPEQNNRPTGSKVLDIFIARSLFKSSSKYIFDVPTELLQNVGWRMKVSASMTRHVAIRAHAAALQAHTLLWDRASWQAVSSLHNGEKIYLIEQNLKAAAVQAWR